MRLGGRFTEEDYQRQQTQLLLDWFGEAIVLKREPEYVDDGAGGVIRPDDADTALDPQVFWFWEAAPVAHIARGSNFQQIIGMGQRITTNYVLLGLPDADVLQDDEFDYGGYSYKVAFLHDDRRFQTIAEVERVGRPDGTEEA
jgi:hypothetical protein